MRLTILLIFLLPSAVFSQETNAVKMQDCYRLDSIKQLQPEQLVFYKKAFSRIELIAFGATPKNYGTKRPGRRVYFQLSIIKGKDSIDTQLITERQVLKEKEMANLMDTLFMFGKRGLTYSSMACYEPRNGILFYDTDGKICGFFEICFACDGLEWNYGFPGVRKCDEYMDILYAYFKTKKIKYGIIKKE
jgi:hypothetical protein